jgi:ribonuclease HI
VSAVEYWVPVLFRDTEVLARCGPDGGLAVGPGGLVEFAYKAGGKRYRTQAEKFVPKPGADIQRGVSAAVPAPAKPARAARPPAAPAAAPLAPAAAHAPPPGRVGGPIHVGDMPSRRGPQHAIQLWTDGACSGNPGPAGLGVSREFRGELIELSEYLGEGTNNIAELTAILRGLALVDDPDAPVDVMTDSEYCIGLLGKGWKAKKNQDLVAELRRSIARFSDVRLIKVPGHAGVEGNERADELARAAIAARRSTRSVRTR